MTAWPILERELRVASRKKGLFIARMIASLAAIVVGAGFLIVGGS